DDEATLARLEAGLAVQDDLGIPSRLLTPAEAAEIVPGLEPGGVLGAAYCAEDGYFDRPQAVVEAFAEAVSARGGEVARAAVLASDVRAAGDPATEQDRWRRRIREHVDELLPILRFVSLPIVVTGFYDMTPDGQPIVDSLEEGLWVAAGFSGHGFMVAPSTGR